MMPYPNEEGSASSILNNKQAQVYVNFVNIYNEMPKLKLLTLNGWELWSNKGFVTWVFFQAQTLWKVLMCKR